MNPPRGVTVLAKRGMSPGAAVRLTVMVAVVFQGMASQRAGAAEQAPESKDAKAIVPAASVKKAATVQPKAAPAATAATVPATATVPAAATVPAVAAKQVPAPPGPTPAPARAPAVPAPSAPVPEQPSSVAGSSASATGGAPSGGIASPLPAPDNLPRGPSIYETGRVGNMGVSDSGVKIKKTQDAAKPKELRVEGATASQTPAASKVPGVMNQAVLGRELRQRLTLLKDCRVEVARQKRVLPTALPAGRVLLRWIVLPDGQVTETQVVATSPVDGHVIDCMKRQMSLWSFSPPTGGPARIERPFKFE